MNRETWEKRYAARKPDPCRRPSRFLEQHLAHNSGGLALDVACGSGRNSLLLAHHGFTVDAVDQSHAGLCSLQDTARNEKLLVRAVQADLEAWPMPRNRYDLVVNIRYLQRSMFPALRCVMRPGGVIVFETFTTRQQSVGHPRNGAFLLRKGELRNVFHDFILIRYEEGYFDSESGPAYLARMIARRPQAD